MPFFKWKYGLMTKNEGLNVGFSGSRSVEGFCFLLNSFIP